MNTEYWQTFPYRSKPRRRTTHGNSVARDAMAHSHFQMIRWRLENNVRSTLKWKFNVTLNTAKEIQIQERTTSNRLEYLCTQSCEKSFSFPTERGEYNIQQKCSPVNICDFTHCFIIRVMSYDNYVSFVIDIWSVCRRRFRRENVEGKKNWDTKNRWIPFLVIIVRLLSFPPFPLRLAHITVSKLSSFHHVFSISTLYLLFRRLLLFIYLRSCHIHTIHCIHMRCTHPN